jgi:hypothetical protein
MKLLTAVRFCALLFTALALAPAAAHLLELPNKIGLSREEYLVVQQIYRGWQLLGIVVFGALLSTLGLAMVVRKRRREFVPAFVAFLCIAGTQLVFWTFTYPANVETKFWTELPAHWDALRRQWEYSHAAAAVLNLLALLSAIVSVLSGGERD